MNAYPMERSKAIVKSSLLSNWLFSITAFTLFIFFFSSCETLKDTSKYQLTDGFYKTKLNDKVVKLYILAGSDSIKAYSKKDLTSKKIDTVKSTLILFPSEETEKNSLIIHSAGTLLISMLLTVLFKYRPPISGFPPQFNATYNGAAYFGYRTDVYKLSYSATPLQIYKRRITHYGYSFGFFTGLGSARIDEFVTQNALSIEYDGLVNLSGFAAIIAIDKLTAGLTLGVDHLLDKNNNLWVNNGKPWIGLSIGLNLN